MIFTLLCPGRIQTCSSSTSASDISTPQYHFEVPLCYVLDTDVIVAALRSDGGASRQLSLAALHRQFELLPSVPLILEYEAVLTRPRQLAASGFSSAEVGRVLDDLAVVAKPVRLAFPWRPRLSDPDHDMVWKTPLTGLS